MEYWFWDWNEAKKGMKSICPVRASRQPLPCQGRPGCGSHLPLCGYPLLESSPGGPGFHHLGGPSLSCPILVVLLAPVLVPVWGPVLELFFQTYLAPPVAPKTTQNNTKPCVCWCFFAYDLFCRLLAFRCPPGFVLDPKMAPKMCPLRLPRATLLPACACLGPSWPVLPPVGAALGHLGLILALPWATLALSWTGFLGPVFAASSQQSHHSKHSQQS